MFSRVAVFGTDAETGSRPQSELRFTANNCVVTSIDIRSVEPVDQKTRDSLQQSVTLAIEITTQSQVRFFGHFEKPQASHSKTQEFAK